ncbi:helix-turn-helix domain-containing protein [Turicibacter sanguinis]|nr:helix-turn-helix domain-containing protein [Turicibacter sanguinis]
MEKESIVSPPYNIEILPKFTTKRCRTVTKIKRILIQKGFSVRELSKAVGVSEQSIHYYVKGKHDIASKTLYRIAKYLNVPMEELIEEE